MSDSSKRLSRAQLQQTQEYARLTQKQRLFVDTYVEGGLLDGNYDAVAATQTAYNCKSRETARIMSYPLMQNVRIVAVLNRHFNTEPVEEFLVMIDRAINNKRITHAQIEALRLRGEVLGFGTRLPNRSQGIGKIIEEVAVENKHDKPPMKVKLPKPPRKDPSHGVKF
jgi:phage terminase small subunit